MDPINGIVSKSKSYKNLFPNETPKLKANLFPVSPKNNKKVKALKSYREPMKHPISNNIDEELILESIQDDRSGKIT